MIDFTNFTTMYADLLMLVTTDFNLRRDLHSFSIGNSCVVHSIDRDSTFSHFVLNGDNVDVYYSWNTGYDHDDYTYYTLPLSWFSDFSIDNFNNTYQNNR